MKKNLNSIDRIVRILLGLVFAVLIFTGTFSGTAAIIFGILAVVLLGTSMVSFCPLYAALGLSTLKKDKKTA
jgi:hypothetical protein